jgi:hypothetical protein
MFRTQVVDESETHISCPITFSKSRTSFETNRIVTLCHLATLHTFIQFYTVGRAVAQRLDAGFPPRRPGFAYRQHVGFVVDKEALGQVFSEYFGFPFHLFLHYHNHPGLTQ